MYSVENLESAIRELYFNGVANEEYSRGEVERLLYGIDYEALVQAVRHHATTVYSYAAQSKNPKSLNYRGADLLGQRATRLYTDFDQTMAEAVTITRTVELWLLEDMTVTAVSCLSVDYGDDAFRTRYRENKGDPWESGMLLDLERLTEDLEALCGEYHESEIPYYEL